MVRARRTGSSAASGRAFALIAADRGPQLLRRFEDNSTWVRFGWDRDDVWLPARTPKPIRAHRRRSAAHRLERQGLGVALGLPTDLRAHHAEPPHPGPLLQDLHGTAPARANLAWARVLPGRQRLGHGPPRRSARRSASCAALIDRNDSSTPAGTAALAAMWSRPPTGAPSSIAMMNVLSSIARSLPNRLASRRPFARSRPLGL